MPDALDIIANAVDSGDDRGATLRIGVVTAVESGGTGRVKLNTTGDVFLNSDADSVLQVGDKVYAITQGPTGVVVGKLGPDRGLPVGTICSYAGSAATLPVGWLECDGRAVSRTTYPELYTRIGTTYGAGDGSTTFNIPNLANRFLLGEGTRARGTTGGAERVTLTEPQMPAHTHGSAGAHTHTVPDKATDTVADGTGASVSDTANSGTNTSSSSGSHQHEQRGNDESHENMPPFLVVFYMIKAV